MSHALTCRNSQKLFIVFFLKFFFLGSHPEKINFMYMCRNRNEENKTGEQKKESHIIKHRTSFVWCVTSGL